LNIFLKVLFRSTLSGLYSAEATFQISQAYVGRDRITLYQMKQ